MNAKTITRNVLLGVIAIAVGSWAMKEFGPARAIATGGNDARPAANVVRPDGVTVISFHGETVTELRREFETAIEDYLLDCTEQGLAPEKPVSGKIMLRVPPEVHGAALVAAQASGKSLNQWATEALKNAAH